MNSISPAYVAGLVDGEGCITIEASWGRFYYPRLYIGMTDKALPLLRAVQVQYGGALKRQRRQTDRWSAAWMLSLTGTAATPLLREMEPHLILKAEQCRLCLELAALVAGRQGSARGDLWDAATMGRAGELLRAVRALNRKGPAVREAV